MAGVSVSCSTPAARSSFFGEDEEGELYVVTLNGTIHKVVNACRATLSPTVQDFGAAGGSGRFSIGNQIECSWTAVAHQSWITLTGASSGTGNGNITYSVAPYIGHALTRAGTITVGDETFSIRQSR